MWQGIRGQPKKPWYYIIAGNLVWDSAGRLPMITHPFTHYSFPAEPTLRQNVSFEFTQFLDGNMATCVHLMIPSGSLVLVAYGFVPTIQPQGASFARSYAVYGGVFIVMSYAWGWAVDKQRPDNGDWVGGSIALAGVAIAWFWPR